MDTKPSFMRDCLKRVKRSVRQKPIREKRAREKDNDDERRKNKTLTSPGPPLTVTFGLLRGALGAAAAGTKHAAALLLVLQTPR